MVKDLPLNDIHLPEAVSWWPLAIGWWVLMVVVVVTLVGGYWLYKRLTRKTATKQAKAILLTIRQNASNDVLQTIKELSACLRRVSISVDSREKTAGLVGDAWLSYLDESMEGAPFKKGIGRLLVDAPYQPLIVEEVKVDALIILCETWVARQKG